MSNSPQEFNGGVPGGNYSAEQAPNGTWTIKALPIFSEVESGKRGNETHIGPEWMNAAIAKSKELREVQQHMAPVHLGHHGALKNKETPRVGFLSPQHIGRLLIEGKPQWVLFADVVGISQENFESLKNLSHPYRSVEIGDWKKPEIASLALLSDESPYFKFPMLTIGQMKAHAGKNPIKFSGERDGNYYFFEFDDSQGDGPQWTTYEKGPYREQPVQNPGNEHEFKLDKAPRHPEASLINKPKKQKAPGHELVRRLTNALGAVPERSVSSEHITPEGFHRVLASPPNTGGHTRPRQPEIRGVLGPKAQWRAMRSHKRYEDSIKRGVWSGALKSMGGGKAPWPEWTPPKNLSHEFADEGGYQKHRRRKYLERKFGRKPKRGKLTANPSVKHEEREFGWNKPKPEQNLLVGIGGTGGRVTHKAGGTYVHSPHDPRFNKQYKKNRGHWNPYDLGTIHSRSHPHDPDNPVLPGKGGVQRAARLEDLGMLSQPDRPSKKVDHIPNVTTSLLGPKTRHKLWSSTKRLNKRNEKAKREGKSLTPWHPPGPPRSSHNPSHRVMTIPSGRDDIMPPEDIAGDEWKKGHPEYNTPYFLPESHPTMGKGVDPWNRSYRHNEFSGPVPVWLREFSGIPIWAGECPHLFNMQPTDFAIRNSQEINYMKALARANRTSKLSPAGRIDGQGFHEFADNRRKPRRGHEEDITAPSSDARVYHPEEGRNKTRRESYYTTSIKAKDVPAHPSAMSTKDLGGGFNKEYVDRHYGGEFVVHSNPTTKHIDHLAKLARKNTAKSYSGGTKSAIKKYVNATRYHPSLKGIYTRDKDDNIHHHVWDSRAAHHHPVMSIFEAKGHSHITGEDRFYGHSIRPRRRPGSSKLSNADKHSQQAYKRHEKGQHLSWSEFSDTIKVMERKYKEAHKKHIAADRKKRHMPVVPGRYSEDQAAAEKEIRRLGKKKSKALKSLWFARDTEVKNPRKIKIRNRTLSSDRKIKAHGHNFNHLHPTNMANKESGKYLGRRRETRSWGGGYNEFGLGGLALATLAGRQRGPSWYNRDWGRHNLVHGVIPKRMPEPKEHEASEQRPEHIPKKDWEELKKGGHKPDISRHIAPPSATSRHSKWANHPLHGGALGAVGGALHHIYKGGKAIERWHAKGVKKGSKRAVTRGRVLRREDRIRKLAESKGLHKDDPRISGAIDKMTKKEYKKADIDPNEKPMWKLWREFNAGSFALQQGQAKRLLSAKKNAGILKLNKNGQMSNKLNMKTPNSALRIRQNRGIARPLSRFADKTKAKWDIQPPGVGWY